MELTNFGNTNLKVTKIGLGLAALGRPGYINLGHGTDLNHLYDATGLENHAHQVLDLAYHYGIRYFDVARSYGRAELFLSNWVKNQRDLAIGSKWGYTYTAGWKVDAEIHEIKEHSIDVLDRQWVETQNTLTPYPDIYHIHSASVESGVLKNKDVIDRLWEMKNHGVIIGLSLSGESQSETLDQSMEIMTNDEYLFQSVQVTWNLLEQSTTQMLEKASAAGYGVIVKEALANGRLTEKNEDSLFREKLHLLKGIAKKHLVGVDAVAISYVLSQHWVSVALSGAANESHLISNLKALSVRLDSDDHSLLNQLTESPADYWKTRSKLEWN